MRVVKCKNNFEWMNDWLIEWMIDWMNDWMIEWLNEWMNERQPDFWAVLEFESIQILSFHFPFNT